MRCAGFIGRSHSCATTPVSERSLRDDLIAQRRRPRACFVANASLRPRQGSRCIRLKMRGWSEAVYLGCGTWLAAVGPAALGDAEHRDRRGQSRERGLRSAQDQVVEDASQSTEILPIRRQIARLTAYELVS